jgi:proton-coupled amino acid transporter
MLPKGDPVVWVLKIVFCFNLIFSYPLMLYPANIAIESYLFNGWPKSKRRQWGKNIYRACMVTFTVVITLAMRKDLDQFLAVLGALACTPVAFLLPTLYHLKVCADTPSARRIDWLIIVIAIIIMVFTTIFDIYEWVLHG